MPGQITQGQATQGHPGDQDITQGANIGGKGTRATQGHPGGSGDQGAPTITQVATQGHDQGHATQGQVQGALFTCEPVTTAQHRERVARLKAVRRYMDSIGNVHAVINGEVPA